MENKDKSCKTCKNESNAYGGGCMTSSPCVEANYQYWQPKQSEQEVVNNSEEKKEVIR